MESGRFSVIFNVVSYYVFLFFQPNSVAAKLLKGRSRRGGDSADFYHQSGSGGKDKATDASNKTVHYGVPQIPAKTPIINALPLSSQRKQPTGSSSFHPAPAGETTNISTFNSFNRHPQHLSATRGHSHPSRVNSHQIKRYSDWHRHLLQVSHAPLYECMLFVLFGLNVCGDFF